MNGMRKSWRYITCIAVILIGIVFSLDIENLDKHRSLNETYSFNAAGFATRFWNDSLPLSIRSAQEAGDFLKLLNDNPDMAFTSRGHKLGISNTYYFMLKGRGTVKKVEDEYLVAVIDDNNDIRIATDFIFGNAVRDGSGKININDFFNMTDFNEVSVEINRLVKEKVVKGLGNTARPGMEIEFAGALELNKENADLPVIRIIPVSIILSGGNSK